MICHATTARAASLQQASLLDQMFRLRARQFDGRRGWKVVVTDGRERDAFDALDPLYIVVGDAEGRLLGSLRLLATTGPHMLTDVFPEVMGGADPIRRPDIWESSRFCVDTEAARAFCANGINLATRRLLLGLFETAQTMRLGQVVSVYDLGVERILRRAGCVFRRTGPVVRYDNDPGTVGGLFEVGSHVIGALSRGLELELAA